MQEMVMGMAVPRSRGDHTPAERRPKDQEAYNRRLENLYWDMADLGMMNIVRDPETGEDAYCLTDEGLVMLGLSECIDHVRPGDPGHLRATS